MVSDNAAQNRFELQIGEHTAFSTYRRTPGVVTILHTEVPEALEGKGVGSQLVRGALEIIRSKGEKVVPKCPFTAAFIQKHPEFQDLVAS